jgi:putative PEP-CTERM system histidine kinase
MSGLSLLILGCAILSLIVIFAVLLRETRSWANWAFVIGLGLLGVEALFIALTTEAADSRAVIQGHQAGLITLALLPGVWLLFSLTYSRGNHRECLRQWRLILLFVVAVPLAAVWGLFGPLLAIHADNNPALLRLDLGGVVIYAVFLIVAVMVLMNLERTFVASIGTMRWRLKFMVLGLGLLFGFRIYSSSQVILFRALNPSLATLNVLVMGLTCLLIGVSLFRSRLFEIEVYPSQTILHGSVVALLAGSYLGVIGILAQIVSALGGDSAFPLKAFLVLLAVAGLGVMLLSDRVRQRTRLFVSRHFRRPTYDYRKVWSDFALRTASLMDRSAFCRAIVKLLSDTFTSLSVTIWFVDEQSRGLSFAASTLLMSEEAGNLQLGQEKSRRLIEGLRGVSLPFDMESRNEAWMADLKEWNPDYFKKGGHRICVPLMAGRDLQGIIVLGDRVSGVRFSLEDMDLLKCLGDQVASSLQNIGLSEKVMRVRAMEAFQTMSTFLVHDLKNVAYTLSLMVKNMADHFENPEFRAEARQNLARSSEHLDEMIGRFSQLRQQMKVNRVEADLNDVVNAALTSLPGVSGINLVREYGAIPKLRLDPEQIQKVITNLVLNAREAISSQGEIKVRTFQENSWSVVAVTDNGAGMSPEFIQRNLFKPFQTTKKNGLGIGLFHSKTIVEAHQGEVEVESAPGKGATFRVLLPLPENKP